MCKVWWKSIEKYGDSYSLNSLLLVPKITLIPVSLKLKYKKKSISLKCGKCTNSMQQILSKSSKALQ